MMSDSGDSGFTGGDNGGGGSVGGDYSGSGGAVGGFSPSGYGGNYSGLTGVGSLSGYQRFSGGGNDIVALNFPYKDKARNNSLAYDSKSVLEQLKSLFSFAQDSLINFESSVSDANNVVDTAANATPIGGSNAAVNVDATSTPTTSAIPSWLSGIFTGIFSGKPISLSFSQNGQTAQASYSGHNYLGNVYAQGGQYYLNLNGDTSLITQTATGIETVNQTNPSAGFVDYLGGNGASISTPTTSTSGGDTSTGQSILDQLSNLLSGGTPSATSFEAPSNLYQVNPSQQTGSTNTMPKLLILVAIAVGAYFLYKKYA